MNGDPRDNRIRDMERRIDFLERRLQAVPSRWPEAPRDGRIVIRAAPGSCTVGMAVRVVSGTCQVHAPNWYGLQGPDCGVIESIINGVASVVVAGPFSPIGTAPTGTHAGIDGIIDEVAEFNATQFLGRSAVLTTAGDQVIPWYARAPAIEGDWTLVPVATDPRAGQIWRYWDEAGLTAPATHTAAQIPTGRRLGVVVGAVADPVLGDTLTIVLWSGRCCYRTGTASVSTGTWYADGATAHAVTPTIPATGPVVTLAHWTDGNNVGGALCIDVVMVAENDSRGRTIHGRRIDPAAPTVSGQAYRWDVLSGQWIVGYPIPADASVSNAKLNLSGSANAIVALNGTGGITSHLWASAEVRWLTQVGGGVPAWTRADGTGIETVSDGGTGYEIRLKNRGVTFAKFAEIAALAVVCRSTNTPGDAEALAAPATNCVFSRQNAVLEWTRFPTLGGNGFNGGVALADSGGQVRIEIDTAAAAFGSYSASKKLYVREVDVCAGGVAKKMLIVASDPY